MGLGLMVEGSVAVLLAVTIGYCAILNQRLKRLQADRETLAQMVRDLVEATDLANKAVAELTETAAETQERIDARLEVAARLEGALSGEIEAGEALLERIARITSLARRPERRPEPSAADPPAEAAAAAVGAQAGETPIQAALRQLASRPRIRGEAA